MAMFKLMIRV